MQIHQDITIVDLALRYKDNLILGDLQLGYEDYLNRQGVFIPRFQTQDTLQRIRAILEQCPDVKTIIFNGDIKHHFGTISPQEWSAVTALIDELIDRYTIIMIKGNHDPLLKPILDNYGTTITFVDSYDLDDITITHGDKLLADHKKTIIIGHEHPAVSFEEKPGEKYKCFLKGTWKKHTLLVMPSFSTLTVGTDIRQGRFLSPYLPESLEQFDVYVIEDKPYHFGLLKNIK